MVRCLLQCHPPSRWGQRGRAWAVPTPRSHWQGPRYRIGGIMETSGERVLLQQSAVLCWGYHMAPFSGVPQGLESLFRCTACTGMLGMLVLSLPRWLSLSRRNLTARGPQARPPPEQQGPWGYKPTRKGQSQYF